MAVIKSSASFESDWWAFVGSSRTYLWEEAPNPGIAADDSRSYWCKQFL